jgi:periplasmic divalent cation tolerance protein
MTGIMALSGRPHHHSRTHLQETTMPGTEAADTQQIRLVLCSCPPAEADRIAAALVDERLAACITVLPQAVSTYRWQGEVAREAEALLLIKTGADRVPALTARIQEIHPYELPEVIAVPVCGGLNAYIAWVLSESAS